MSHYDMQEMVWRQLGVRKHLVGRERIDELADMAVANWPCEVLGECRGDEDFETVAQASIASLRRRVRSREYGVLLTILLSGLASAVFQILLRWWLERRANRVLMLVWRQEAMQ